jgi:DNA replication protein DnaC
MKTADTVDAARVELFLADLRLPAIKQVWTKLAEQSDKEGWPAARFLAALAEHEIADRGRRRIERHLVEARLPAGKTLDSFDFEAVPMVSKAQVMALTAGDSWLEKGANLLLFGPTESDSYCSSPDLPTIPALFVADCQTADAEDGEPALLL